MVLCETRKESSRVDASVSFPPLLLLPFLRCHRKNRKTHLQRQNSTHRQSPNPISISPSFFLSHTSRSTDLDQLLHSIDNLLQLPERDVVVGDLVGEGCYGVLKSVENETSGEDEGFLAATKERKKEGEQKGQLDKPRSAENRREKTDLYCRELTVASFVPRSFSKLWEKGRKKTSGEEVSDASREERGRREEEENGRGLAEPRLSDEDQSLDRDEGLEKRRLQRTAKGVKVGISRRDEFLTEGREEHVELTSILHSHLQQPRFRGSTSRPSRLRT